MQRSHPYVLVWEPPAAAHGKPEAAKRPHDPVLLTVVGSQHHWSVHFLEMDSLCNIVRESFV